MNYSKKLLAILTPLGLISNAMATLVFVPDQASGSILKFVGETGEYKGIIGNGFVGTNVRSLEMNPVDGYLYVNTIQGGQGLIQRFDPYTGAYAGSLGNGFLTNPRGMCFGEDGKLYVIDNLGANSLIFRFNPTDGAYAGSLANGFLGNMTNSGSIVSIGANLFVTGGGGTNIQKFKASDGAYLGAIGSGFFSDGYGLSTYNDAGNDILMVGSFSSTAILKFSATDSSYKGIFASGFVPIGRGIASLPNGQAIARSRSTTGVDYICRFVPSTGEYKGLFAANFNIIGVDLASETPANLDLTVDLLDWDDVNCTGQPITVEIRDNVTAAVLETYTVPSASTQIVNIDTYLRGTYSIAVKSSHFLRKVVNNVLIGRAGATASFALINGDINDDNFVGFDDFDILSAAFNTSNGDPGYAPNADLNCDDFIGFDDFDILSANFNQAGDD